MEELRQRILDEGIVLGGTILKIDSLLNHQIDPGLMARIGEEIARRFSSESIDRVLTAEVSGIAPALMAGLALDVPVVYARKHRPITMDEPVYVQSAPSHTKGGEINLMVSPRFILAGERVLIVDDFLASGKTLYALAKIVQAAGAKLTGIVCVVEKEFQGGRSALSELNTRIDALVTIKEMRDGMIILAD